MPKTNPVPIKLMAALDTPVQKSILPKSQNLQNLDTQPSPKPSNFFFGI